MAKPFLASPSHALIALLLAACAAQPVKLADHAGLVLTGSDARAHDVRAELGNARLTVFVFAAKSCACLDAHAARLRELSEVYTPRGVAFHLVDSEVGASAERATDMVRRGGYPFTALADPGARLAEALGAEFASHTVVVDAAGQTRYSGGIDSDSTRLHDDAKLFLRDALDDLLAGKSARVARSEALGCALQLN